MKCPECGREDSHKPGTVTYGCVVPKCRAFRICCTACLGNHYRKHGEELNHLRAIVAELHKNVELFIRCVHADPYSDIEPGQIPELLDGIAKRFDEGIDALALVAELPKCNRLNDDKTALELECPVVPGMEVWVVAQHQPYKATVQQIEVGGFITIGFEGATYREVVEYELYNSLEAAEFAKKGTE